MYAKKFLGLRSHKSTASNYRVRPDTSDTLLGLQTSRDPGDTLPCLRDLKCL